jgi:hypothetical protein
VTPGSEAEAYALLEQLRWGGAPQACPHCAATGGCYYLRPADGTSRRTRTGALTQRRVWKCASCRRQFSVLTGTVFEGTRISLRTWIGVLDDRARAAEPPTAGRVALRYGLSGEAARQVVQRIAAALEDPAARSASAGGRALIAAVLGIPAGRAVAIRARTPGRRRPLRQVGPSAVYGGDEA